MLLRPTASRQAGKCIRLPSGEWIALPKGEPVSVGVRRDAEGTPVGITLSVAGEVHHLPEVVRLPGGQTVTASQIDVALRRRAIELME